jgi:hypothetical protein
MTYLHLNCYCPSEKRGQQQEALIICTKNVRLWHPLLAKGDSYIFLSYIVTQRLILLTRLKYGNVGYLA